VQEQAIEQQPNTYCATVEDVTKDREEQQLHITFFDSTALSTGTLSVTTPIDASGSQYPALYTELA
jgi:hypothetical protein